VLIDALKGTVNHKTELLGSLLAKDIPFGIASYTYQEVLQGAKSESEYVGMQTYFSSIPMLFLPERKETYEKAARIYATLRRNGITPRSMIDVYIALLAMEYSFALLHNDRDFDHFAAKIPELRILNRLND
jgi:hypothetical protein